MYHSYCIVCLEKHNNFFSIFSVVGFDVIIHLKRWKFDWKIILLWQIFRIIYERKNPWLRKIFGIHILKGVNSYPLISTCDYPRVNFCFWFILFFFNFSTFFAIILTEEVYSYWSDHIWRIFSLEWSQKLYLSSVVQPNTRPSSRLK